MRPTFSKCLLEEMMKDEKIYLLCGDLGWKMFDSQFAAFPDRVINCGASEQAMMDIAVGLAYAGKTVFVYSITTFLLYRPFETIRTYINHEKLNIKLIASGRDKDYEIDGISHDSSDAIDVLKTLPNIQRCFPDDASEIQDIVSKMVLYNKPYFLSLRR